MSLYQEAFHDDDEPDSYMKPRALLVNLVSKTFPIFDENLAKTVAENILFKSIRCLPPDEMDEQWAREEVEYYFEKYRKQVLAGEKPSMTFSENFTQYLRVISQAEKDAGFLISEEAWHIEGNPEKAEEIRENVRKARLVLAAEKAKREAFVQQIKIGDESI
jgi:hypothetical protein